MIPLTLRTAQLFLGRRIQCIQCHDHPFEVDSRQRQFWGLNAFFRQVERREAPLAAKKDPTKPLLELLDNPAFNASGLVFAEKRNGVVFFSRPVFLDGTKIPAGTGTGTGAANRREVLAELVVKHPNFGRALVNRLWGHFFGRGLNQLPEVDDFGEDHNPTVHGKLLDRLAGDFVRGGHDPKQLIRWICASEAYGFKSVANATNTPADAVVHFSRMPLKVLPADALIESLLVATGKRDSLGEAELPSLRADWRRQSVVPVDRTCETPPPPSPRDLFEQVSWLLNSSLLEDATARGGTVARAMKRGSIKLVAEELYLAALGRRPGEKEWQRIAGEITAFRKAGGRDLTPLWQDLLWALLNSNEFLLNH
jgi:hypothetical protein